MYSKLKYSTSVNKAVYEIYMLKHFWLANMNSSEKGQLVDNSKRKSAAREK